MPLRTRAILVAFCMNFAVFVSIQTLALAQSEATTLTGRLAMLWVDAFDNGEVVEAPPIVTLLDDAGVEHELSLAPALVAAQGGIVALQGRRVTVAVDPATAAQTGAAQQVHALLAVEPAAAPPVLGNERWVIVLCRAEESAVVVPNPLEHYTRLWSNTFPGVEHYWRELSYDQYSVAGVSVHGWYDLPQPGSAYWYQHTDGNYRLNTQTVREDCATAADGDVDFPAYAGIIFVVPMPASIGYNWMALGGFWMLNRDGMNKMYRTAFLPREVGYSEDNDGFMSQNVLVHEMGHGLGLPHSSGPYAKTYDSSWDVMSGFSAASARCEWDETYGCIAPHTIAYHKDRLGWFVPDRKLIVAPTSPQMVTVARMAQPRSGAPFFIQIPLTTDGKRFYTVEYRGGRGYDRSAPYGVVIHEVDTARPDRTAQVVDPDGNGDPTDSGASWVPGEVFRDAANNVHVCIEADAGSDVLVGIGGGADLTCPFAPHFESNVAFGANTQYPTTGAVMDMYLEMTNGGAGVAPDVAVTITLPAQVAVITDTIDTMNGVVRSLDPFVFGVGDMAYDDYAHVIFQVQIDPALTDPAELESIVEITWTGGSLQKALIQIANPRFVYLPAIQR